MSMNKIADIQLETTAEYQSLSKLNVKFWNQDKGTAVLKFNITRNNYPLGLSEENVKIFVALESGDSFLVDDNLEYLDELNGVVSYTIPNDFMRVANNVLGQVYVTTLDEEEVIVQRQFSFKVANDLIAEIPSEEKLKEFKYFSDMRAEVAKMMEKLNNDFENMNDYVTQVENTTQAGINELNNLITQKEKAYNDNHTKKMKEITDKGNQYTNDFTNQRQYIDTKYTDFQNAVQGSGLVTTSQSSNWQKHKLTGDTGDITFKTGFDFNNIEGSGLKSGFYIISNGINAPSGVSNYGYLRLLTAGNNYVEATYRPHNTDKVYVAYKWSGTWTPFSTPTEKMETITGSQSKANVAESNARIYAKDLVDGKTALLFEGTANGVGKTINLSETLDNFVALFIYVSFPGGWTTVLGNPYGTVSIPLNVTNLVDTDGSTGGIYEVILSKTTRTQLTITNDVYYDIGLSKGSGANANRCSIMRIVGVRK